MAVKLGTKLTPIQKQQRAQKRLLNKNAGKLVKHATPEEKRRRKEQRRLNNYKLGRLK